jgi:hypothetical protein
MTKRLIAVALAILAGTLAFSQQKAPPQRAAIPRRVLQEAVLGFYVSEFQKQAEVTPEVFGKILPFLNNSSGSI